MTDHEPPRERRRIVPRGQDSDDTPPTPPPVQPPSELEVQIQLLGAINDLTRVIADLADAIRSRP